MRFGSIGMIGMARGMKKTSHANTYFDFSARLWKLEKEHFDTKPSKLCQIFLTCLLYFTSAAHQ